MSEMKPVTAFKIGPNASGVGCHLVLQYEDEDGDLHFTEVLDLSAYFARDLAAALTRSVIANP